MMMNDVNNDSNINIAPYSSCVYFIASGVMINSGPNNNSRFLKYNLNPTFISLIVMVYAFQVLFFNLRN